jgi:hypothetical protein
LPLKVLVIGDHERMVQTVRLSYVLPGSSSRGGLEVAASRGDAVLMIPLPALGARPGTLKYHIEVLDKDHNVLVRKGELDEPLTVRLVEAEGGAAVARTEAEATPWYGKWWVWAIAGAVVAGVTTAAVATTAQPDSSKVGLEWEVSGSGN